MAVDGYGRRISYQISQRTYTHSHTRSTLHRIKTSIYPIFHSIYSTILTYHTVSISQHNFNSMLAFFFSSECDRIELIVNLVLEYHSIKSMINSAHFRISAKPTIEHAICIALADWIFDSNFVKLHIHIHILPLNKSQRMIRN